MRIDFPNRSYIEATEISLPEDFTVFSIGENVKIRVRGMFSIGERSRFGSNVSVVGENVTIGTDFFHHTPGLNIGGGGSHLPEANLTIGDRVVMHDNYLNLCCPITIGNDVGLSPGVDLLTHGFWGSPLKGFPYKYSGIRIDDGVIVGQQSLILPGVTIAKNCVIGAGSVVTKPLLEGKSVYAGNPAKFIRKIEEPSEEAKKKIADTIMERYEYLVKHFGVELFYYFYEYPLALVNYVAYDFETNEFSGEEDVNTDAFRDHLRRYGIKIYTARPFGLLGAK